MNSTFEFLSSIFLYGNFLISLRKYCSDISANNEDDESKSKGIKVTFFMLLVLESNVFLSREGTESAEENGCVQTFIYYSQQVQYLPR